jgi:hypothetical protein
MPSCRGAIFVAGAVLLAFVYSAPPSGAQAAGIPGQAYPPPPDNAQRAEPIIGIKTDISPKETQIYIDGYYRGTAGDFGGFSKHLRVEPGPHEFVLYLKGYKTVRQTLDVKPGTDYRLREKMVPLAAGEANDPPPAAPPQAVRAPEAPEGRAGAPGQPSPDEPRRGAPRPPRPPQPARPELPQPGAPAAAQSFGSLAIRVQPAGADILVDGERWQGPEGAPLVVQVAAGAHRVEVRKEGYESFATDVQVREGERTPVNVSLPARQ